MTLADIETGELVEQPNLWLDDAVGHHVAGNLTQDEALTVTAKIKAYAGTAWLLLYAAHERKAHKALGYKTWEAYVRAEFDLSRSQSYRLLSQAEVVLEIADLSPMGDTLPNERQARELAKLPDPAARAEAWAEAAEEAETEGRDVTAKDVQKRVERRSQSVTTETVPTTAGEEGVGSTEAVPAPSEPDDPIGTEPVEQATKNAEDNDVTYRARLSSARKAALTLTKLDPERAAAVSLIEDRESDIHFIEMMTTWLDEFEQALHRSQIRSVS